MKLSYMLSNFKLHVEQQDAIKHLKEYCDIDDIEPPMKGFLLTMLSTICMKNMVEKNIFRKCTLSCCEIIVAKCLNQERN